MVVCLGTKEETDESIWIRVRGQTNMGDIVVSGCYVPPYQGENVGEAFFT